MDRNKVITKPQNLAADLGPVLALFLLGELLKEIEVLESAWLGQIKIFYREIHFVPFLFY